MLYLLLTETLALVGGTVHSMKPGDPPRVATILIENDRIEAVGPDVSIPSAARRVDLSGYHVLPGLIDGMIDHDPDHDVLYVSAGVTLARDVGNDLARILAETDRNARERSPGPWLWVSGSVVDGPKPATSAVVVVGSASEAETKLKTLFDFEPTIDFVSLRPGVPLDAWKKVIEVAHGARKQVWGPLPTGASLADAGAAGQDGLYHLEAFRPAGKTWDQLAPEAWTLEDWKPIVDAALAAKVAVTPTLCIFGERLVAPQRAESELEYLGPFYTDAWLAELAGRRRNLGDDEPKVREELKRRLAAVRAQGALVKALHQRGVPIVPGSATGPIAWLFPGDALLDELLLLRLAGIESTEVLRLVTQASAARLGLEKRGTIERYKIADLVVTKEDPAVALEALKDPSFVVLRGQVLSRADIDAKKQALAQRQAQIKAAIAKPLPVGEPDLPTGDVLLRGWVETRTLGARLSSERYAVVRRYDGGLTYCGRLVVPGSATTPGTETWIQQTIRDGELDVFTLRIKAGALDAEFTSERAGGRLNVVRRDGGTFVSNTPISQKLAFVDAGSVTSALILGYQRKEGDFKVLFLEDLQLGVAPWRLRLDTDGTTHLVKTHQGGIKATYGALGAPDELWRETGNGRTLTTTLEVEAPDGRGLPTPKDKRAVPAASSSGSDAPKKAGGG